VGGEWRVESDRWRVKNGREVPRSLAPVKTRLIPRRDEWCVRVAGEEDSRAGFAGKYPFDPEEG
jgi:hypothetical protein